MDDPPSTKSHFLLSSCHHIPLSMFYLTASSLPTKATFLWRNSLKGVRKSYRPKGKSLGNPRFPHRSSRSSARNTLELDVDVQDSIYTPYTLYEQDAKNLVAVVAVADALQAEATRFSSQASTLAASSSPCFDNKSSPKTSLKRKNDDVDDSDITEPGTLRVDSHTGSTKR